MFCGNKSHRLTVQWKQARKLWKQFNRQVQHMIAKEGQSSQCSPWSSACSWEYICGSHAVKFKWPATLDTPLCYYNSSVMHIRTKDYNKPRVHSKISAAHQGCTYISKQDMHCLPCFLPKLYICMAAAAKMRRMKHLQLIHHVLLYFEKINMHYISKCIQSCYCTQCAVVDSDRLGLKSSGF